MNITFIGAGYVGLGTGIMLSDLGHNVTCIDTNEVRIEQLKSGVLPIYEPGLEQYLTKNIANGRLKFSSEYSEELKDSKAVFITVWTPSQENGEADLSYLFDSVDSILPFINNDCVIVIKSTVPPGTCQKLINKFAEQKLNYLIVSNPEFLREGSAIEDFLFPARIVVGSYDPKATEILAKIYEPLTSKNIPFINTDPATAELIKYASNAYLATKLAFVNEMANLCEKIPADIERLTYAMGLDKRIGKEFLKAGPGFGGSCFPKDILALSSIAKSHQTDFQVLDAVINSNKERPAHMINKIRDIVGDLEGKNITVLGLTFKANTDDIRSSPAIDIVNLLIEAKANVCAFDPAGMNNAEKVLDGVVFADSAFEACASADAIVITTEWEEFKSLDFKSLYTSLKDPIIIDLRNILNAELIKEIGFKHYSIG